MVIALSILFLLLQIGFAIFIFYLIIAFITGAPFVPTSNPAAQTMIDFAGIKPGMRIYDLGSGDGRLLFLAAQKGSKAIGFEINPWLVWFTNLKAWVTHSPQVKAKWQNFWSAKLSDADVVFVYLLPWRMGELAQKLTKDLRPGTLIVSNSFIFPNWPIRHRDDKQHIYVFRV